AHEPRRGAQQPHQLPGGEQLEPELVRRRGASRRRRAGRILDVLRGGAPEQRVDVERGHHAGHFSTPPAGAPAALGGGLLPLLARAARAPAFSVRAVARHEIERRAYGVGYSERASFKDTYG